MQMIQRVALIVSGWIAVAVGVVGLFLPVLPGVLLLLLGLWLLSNEYPWARRWSGELRRRFPATTRRLDRFFGA
jgi:uncharacterized membrane protein YbaN (DUF454 family)